jgi:hypothetical protein
MAKAPDTCMPEAADRDDRPCRLEAQWRPNPIPPDSMTPAQRREELCAILAVGLARLHRRNFPELYDEKEGFPLHFTSEQSGSAAPTHWRNAQ